MSTLTTKALSLGSKLKPTVAALALGLATLSGTASAITLYPGVTTFEDDNVDFLIKGAGNTLATTIQTGDTLVSIIKINFTTQGVLSSAVAPQQLSGVAAITLTGFADLDGLGGANDMVFGASTLGLNHWLGLGGAGPVTGGAAGGGATAALYLSNADALTVTGATNCAGLADCVTKATAGNLFEVDGFAGDADEFWIALNAATDTTLVLTSSEVTKAGFFNFGQSILDDGGNTFIKDGLTCTGVTALYCGGDKKIDVLGSGDILGGGFTGVGLGLNAAVKADGAFAHSDFDFQKAVYLPEPATVALMGLGLLGLGFGRRKQQG